MSPHLGDSGVRTLKSPFAQSPQLGAFGVPYKVHLLGVLCGGYPKIRVGNSGAQRSRGTRGGVKTPLARHSRGIFMGRPSGAFPKRSKKGPKKIHAGALFFGCAGAPSGRPSRAASRAEPSLGVKKAPQCRAALLPPLVSGGDVPRCWGVIPPQHFLKEFLKEKS